LDTDSYKASHYRQYPPGTTSMFSYFESRGGEYDATAFFGLQYLLKEYLTKRVTIDMVLEARDFFGPHGLPFNFTGWQRIAYDLNGRLPVRIRAVPEGTVVPNGNVLMTVESTDPKTFWVASWLETMLVRTWYPSTVATRSRSIRHTIKYYLDHTSDDPEGEIGFKLHDFGGRGATTRESAAVGGMAHLTSFQGSDNVPGIRAANRYYNEGMAAFSIPAAEHSTITAWSREGELAAYKNMLDQFAKPGALVAVVSDSYDLWRAIDNFWGAKLRDQIVDSGATVIIRPDSGDPPTVVLRALEHLDAAFGSTRNEKGYRVLNHVRVIQGDGVNEQAIAKILSIVTGAGYSATNVAFGMGGGLLQQLDRDTLKFAYKCSSVVVNGQHREVRKTPITDHGKSSKGGRLDLVMDKDGLRTAQIRWGMPSCSNSVMQTVYKDGELLVDQSLTSIRERVLCGVPKAHDLELMGVRA
jgi:nicotinamide phosphoribosyltransferase